MSRTLDNPRGRAVVQPFDSTVLAAVRQRRADHVRHLVITGLRWWLSLRAAFSAVGSSPRAAHRLRVRFNKQGLKAMVTAKELRLWAANVRQWVARIDDAHLAQSATDVAAEMDRLAARKEVLERQFV